MQNRLVNKVIVIGIVIFFIGASIVPVNCSKILVTISKPDTVYVDDDFNESIPGWGYDHFDNIQDGLGAVNESGMVYVYNGTYYENVIVNKIVNLNGEEKNTTIIEGGGNGNVVKISADWINISGFKIRNSGIFDAGIEIKSNYNTITGNDISNNEYGIILLGSSNNTIMGNAIMNNEGGIYLYKSSNNKFTCNNISSNNYVGIFLWNSSNNNITCNNISSNYYDGIDLEFSSNNNTITDNTISNNYRGIYLEFSKNNTITCNNISSNNDNGIYLRDSSNNNIIYHNNIINNIVNATDECNNTWDNGYPSGGNYWDDYTGNDNNSDCIGDTPYNITGGVNQDLYPFMYPNGWINHPPSIPYNPEPGPGATNIPIGVNLCWIGCDPDPCDTLTFDVYFGTSTHPPKVVSNQTETCFEVGILDFSTVYYWMVVAWDNHGANTIGPLWSFTTEDNNPPHAPIINGPTSGKPGDTCIYSFEAIDPEEHDIYYYIEWGYGTNTTWLGPYNSGEKIYKSHSWSEKGTFTIKAKAKDVYEAVGEWGTFEVTMPKDKIFVFNFPLLSWLFERFPNSFPLLRYIIGI